MSTDDPSPPDPAIGRGPEGPAPSAPGDLAPPPGGSPSDAGSRWKRRRLLLGLLALVGVIFVTDLLLPRGSVEGVMYVAAVLLALWLPSRRHVVLVAGVASLLTVAALVPAGPDERAWLGLLNRALVMVAIWATALIALERRRKETELRESEDRYRVVAETAADALLTIDSRSRIRLVNPAVERVFGWRPAALLGRELADLMPERFRAAHHEGLYRYLSTGRRNMPWEGVRMVALHKDGRELPVEVSFGHFRRGGEDFFAGIVRDLSERLRVDEALRRSQESYQGLVDSVDGIVWEAEPGEGRYAFVSKRAERLLGYPVERWVQEPGFWRSRLHEEDREEAAAARQTALATARPCEIEYRMVAADGRTVWIRDVITVAAPPGATPRLRGIAIDVTESKRVLEALRESERRLSTIVASAPVILFATDARGVLTLSEGRGLAGLGLRPGETVGQSVYELYSDVPQIEDNIRRALAGDAFSDTVRVGDLWFDCHYIPLRKDGGQVTGVIGVAIDDTERQRAAAALKVSEERYALAARGANDGIWDWDMRKNQFYYSPRWKKMLGYADHEVADRSEEWFSRVHPDDIDALRVAIRAHLDGATAHLENEHRMLHRDGTYRWMLSRGIAVSDHSGTTTRMAGSMTDITDRMTTGQQLVHNAFHDALTGLPNRSLFAEHLERALDRAKRRDDYTFAVLFIDLDRLKVVNDSLGHLAGDQLLIEMSRRLKAVLRPGDLAARFGGDEFGVLVDDIKDVTEATLVAERIQTELKPGFDLGSQEVYCTASNGIALSSTIPDRADDLLRAADTAMYRAKALGGARHVVFHGAMHARAVALLQLETDLRRALSTGDLRISIEYQPIVSLETGQITGFEALGRWRHPQRGLVSPSEFIPVAEETGLIIPIGRWMLHEACKQMQAWQGELGSKPLLTMSVNLSSKQLHQGDLVEEIAAILQETGLDPRALNLEITESALVEATDVVSRHFSRLKELKVRVQLDDFGTGYSSLSYLLRFPIDTLKIDRAFVTNLEDGSETREIVQTIVTLARHLNMKVIAEGVETAGQVARLREIGCQYAQGYYFSRPLSAAAAGGLVAGAPRW